MSRVPYRDNVRGHRPVIITDEDDERPQSREVPYSHRNREEARSSYFPTERSGQHLNQRGQSQPSRYTPERGSGDYRQTQFAAPGYRSGAQYRLYSQSCGQSYSQPRGQSQTGPNQQYYNKPHIEYNHVQSRNQNYHPQSREQTNYHQSRDQRNYPQSRDQSNHYQSRERSRERYSYDQSPDQNRGNQSSDLFLHDQSSGQYRYNQPVDRNGYNQSSDQYRRSQPGQYLHKHPSDGPRSTSRDRDRYDDYDSSPDRHRSSSGGPFRDHPRREPKPAYSPPYTFSSPSVYKPYESEPDQHHTSRRESERGRSRFPKSSSQANPSTRSDIPYRDASHRSSQTRSREREEVHYISDDSRDRTFHFRHGNSRDRDMSRDSSSDGSCHVRRNNSRERTESHALVEEVKRERYAQSKRERNKKVSPGQSRNLNRNDEEPILIYDEPEARFEDKKSVSTERNQGNVREHASSDDDAMNLDEDIIQTDIEQFVPYSRVMVGHQRHENISGNLSVGSSTIDVVSVLKKIQETVNELNTQSTLNVEAQSNKSSVKIGTEKEQKKETGNKQIDNTNTQKDHTNVEKTPPEDEIDALLEQDFALKDKKYIREKNVHARFADGTQASVGGMNKSSTINANYLHRSTSGHDNLSSKNMNEKPSSYTDNATKPNTIDATYQHSRTRGQTSLVSKNMTEKPASASGVDTPARNDSVHEQFEKTKDNDSKRADRTVDSDRNPQGDKLDKRRETAKQKIGESERRKSDSSAQQVHSSISRTEIHSDQSRKDRKRSDKRRDTFSKDTTDKGTEVSSRQKKNEKHKSKSGKVDLDNSSVMNGDKSRCEKESDKNNTFMTKQSRVEKDNDKNKSKSSPSEILEGVHSGNIQTHSSKLVTEKQSSKSDTIIVDSDEAVKKKSSANEDKHSKDNKSKKHDKEQDTKVHVSQSNKPSSHSTREKHDSNRDKKHVSVDQIHRSSSSKERHASEKDSKKHKDGINEHTSDGKKEKRKSGDTIKPKSGSKTEINSGETDAVDKVKDINLTAKDSNQQNENDKHKHRKGGTSKSSSKKDELSKHDGQGAGENKTKKSRDEKHSSKIRNEKHSSKSQREKHTSRNKEQLNESEIGNDKNSNLSKHKEKHVEKIKKKGENDEKGHTSAKNKESVLSKNEIKYTAPREDKTNKEGQPKKDHLKMFIRDGGEERKHTKAVNKHMASHNDDDQQASTSDKGKHKNSTKHRHDKEKHKSKISDSREHSAKYKHDKEKHEAKKKDLKCLSTVLNLDKDGVDLRKDTCKESDAGKREKAKAEKKEKSVSGEKHEKSKPYNKIDASTASYKKATDVTRNDKNGAKVGKLMIIPCQIDTDSSSDDMDAIFAEMEEKHEAKKIDLKDHSFVKNLDKDGVDHLRKDTCKELNAVERETAEAEKKEKSVSGEKHEKSKPHNKIDASTASYKKATDVTRNDKSGAKVEKLMIIPCQIDTDSSSDDMDAIFAETEEKNEAKKIDLKDHSFVKNLDKDGVDHLRKDTCKELNAVERETAEAEKKEKSVSGMKHEKCKTHKKIGANADSYKKATDVTSHDKNGAKVGKLMIIPSKKDTLFTTDSSSDDMDAILAEIDDVLETNIQNEDDNVKKTSKKGKDDVELQRQTSFSYPTVLPEVPTTSKSDCQRIKSKLYNIKRLKERNGKLFWKSIEIKNPKVAVKRLNIKKRSLKIKNNTGKGKSSHGKKTADKFKRIRRVSSQSSTDSDMSDVVRPVIVAKKKDENPFIESDIEESAKTGKNAEQEGEVSDNEIEESYNTENVLPDKLCDSSETIFKPETANFAYITSNSKRKQSDDSSCTSKSESSKVKRAASVDSNCSTKSRSSTKSSTVVGKVDNKKQKDKEQSHTNLNSSKVSRTKSLDSNCSARSDSELRSNTKATKANVPGKVSRKKSVDSNGSERSESELRSNVEDSQVNALKKVSRKKSVDSNCSTRFESEVRSNTDMSQAKVPEKITRKKSVDSNCSIRSESENRNSTEVSQANVPGKVSRKNSVDSNCSTRSESSIKSNKEVNQTNLPRKVSRTNSVDSNSTTRSEASVGIQELTPVKVPGKVSRTKSVDSNCTTRSETSIIGDDEMGTITNNGTTTNLPEIDMEPDKTDTQMSSLLFQTESPEASQEILHSLSMKKSETKAASNKRLRRRHHSVHAQTSTERGRKLRALSAFVDHEESGVEGDIEDNDITMITLNLDDHKSDSEEECIDQKNRNDTEEPTQNYSETSAKNYIPYSNNHKVDTYQGTVDLTDCIDKPGKTTAASEPILQENDALQKKDDGEEQIDLEIKEEKLDASGQTEITKNIVDIKGTNKTPQPRQTDVQSTVSKLDEPSDSLKKSEGEVAEDDNVPEIKQEPAWLLRGYTQEPDVILLSDDDEIIMSFSQPVINLDTDSEEEIKNLSGKVKVKQETSDWSDEGSFVSSSSDIRIIDLGSDISSGNESDLGSDYFDPEDMFGTELLGKADQGTVAKEEPIVKPAQEEHYKIITDTTTKAQPSADDDFSSSGDEILINTAFDSQMTQPFRTAHPVEKQDSATKTDPYHVATQLPTIESHNKESVEKQDNATRTDPYIATRLPESHKPSKTRNDRESERKHVSFVPGNRNINRNIKNEEIDPYLQETQVTISSDSGSEVDALDYKSEHILRLKNSDSQAKVYEAETQIPDDMSNQHDNLDDGNNELYQMQTQVAEQVSDIEPNREITSADESDVPDSFEDPQMQFYNGTKQIQQSGADRLGIKIDYSFEEAVLLNDIDQPKSIPRSGKSDKTSPNKVRFSDDAGTDDNDPMSKGFDYTAQTQVTKDWYESSEDIYSAETQYSDCDQHDSFIGAGSTHYNDQTLVDNEAKVEEQGEESDFDGSLYAAVTQVDKSLYTAQTQVDLSAGVDHQLNSSDDALYAAQTQMDLTEGVDKDQLDNSDDALYSAQTLKMTSNMKSDEEEADDRYNVQTQMDQTVENNDDDDDHYDFQTQMDQTVGNNDDDDDGYDVQTQIDPTVENTDEDPYIAATQAFETPPKKNQNAQEHNKADSLKSNRLKRPIQHTDSGGFQVQECPLPAKKARGAIEIQPQRQKSITEKRKQGILIKPGAVKTSDKSAPSVTLDEDAPRLPPPRSDIFVQNATKKDMWLSKEVGSSTSTKTSATTPGKSRKRRRTKSKEDPGALLSAQMKEARAKLQERNFKSIVNPEAIADPAKRLKPAATVAAPEDLEDADFPTCSQIVRQGLPMLNETPMLLKQPPSKPAQTGRFASRAAALTEEMLTSSARPVKTSSVSTVTSTTTVSMATGTSSVTYSTSSTGLQTSSSTSSSDSTRHLEKQLSASSRQKHSSGSDVSKDKDRSNSGSSRDKHPHGSSSSKDKHSRSSYKRQDSSSSRDKRSASKDKHSDKPSSSKDKQSGSSSDKHRSSRDRHSSDHRSSKRGDLSVTSKDSKSGSNKDSCRSDALKENKTGSSKDNHSSDSTSNKESGYKPLSLLDVESLMSLSARDRQPSHSKGKQPASSHGSSKSKQSSASTTSGTSASRDRQASSASSSPKDSFQRDSKNVRDRRPSSSSSSKDSHLSGSSSNASKDRPPVESITSKEANSEKLRTSNSSDQSVVLKQSDSSKHRAVSTGDSSKQGTSSSPVSSNPAIPSTSSVHTLAPAFNKQPSMSGTAHRQPPIRTSPLYDDKRPRDVNSNVTQKRTEPRPNLMLKPGYGEPTAGPSSSSAMYGSNVWPSTSTGRKGSASSATSYAQQIPAHPLSRDLRPPPTAQGRSPGISSGQPPPTWSSPLLGNSSGGQPLLATRGAPPAPQMREGECMNWSRFLSVILKWSPKWFTEKAAMVEKGNYTAPPPPVTQDLQGPREVTLWPLVERYESYREYCDTFMLPLLLHETWESCYKEWKEKKERYSQKLLCNQQMHSGDRTLELKLAGLMSKSERRAGAGFKEGDLVQVHLTRAKVAPAMPDQTELVMGYVEKVETQDHHVDKLCKSRPEFVALRKPDSQVITLTLKIRKRDWAASQEHLIELKEIGSIVTTRRQWCALYALNRSPLCDDLLRPEGGPSQTYRDRAPSSICQLQTKFNPSQSEAINTAAKITALPKDVGRICLLQGPPGTGKSHTIIGIIESILKIKGRKGCICLCAPSNAAVDELLRRLHQLRRDKRRCVNFVRLGKKSGMHPDIQQYSVEALAEKNIKKAKQDERLKRLPASVQTEIKTLSAKVQDQKDKIEQTTDPYQRQRLKNDLKKLLKNVEDIEKKCKLDKSDLIQDPRLERDTRRNVLMRADVIAGTLSSFGSSQIRNFQQNFDCVIIDEATQAIELDTLIPLQYGASKLILVGDPEQLSPTVISQVAKDNKLWLSLFERLHGYFSRVYAQDPQQNPVILLDTQYRMNPEISQFPSTYIYDRRLKDDPSVERRATCELEPYILFDIQEGQEQFSQTTSSMSNLAEAYFVAELCNFIVKRTWVTERVIGIITTYAKQRKTIETELQKKGLKNVEVSTVDGFQGQERHVIILSCVRANDTGAVGFVGNRNRMNVALTRAKYAMYLVGHLDVLESNDEWKPLLANARERNKIIPVTERTSRQDIQFCLKKTSQPNT